MIPIYLDNAATSFPKPPCVTQALMQCVQKDCGNAGRGSHALALASAERIYRCREAVADFFGSHDPLRVIFTLNTTYAINFLLKGVLRQGDHVLISELEHNAVLRPLVQLKQSRGISYDTFTTSGGAQQICADILAKYRPSTRVLICTHQSNICSRTLPLQSIGELCHQLGILFFVDAAQSAGHLPIDMSTMNIDALCAPGHKGLLGIQGCGFCLMSEAVTPEPLIEGGSGYQSISPYMPSEFPERGEAGTLPTPAITALESGIRYLTEVGTTQIRQKEEQLFCRLRDAVYELPGYTVLLPDEVGSTLSLTHRTHSPDTLGSYLAEQGICVRSGLHCAPLAHQALGTPQGTLRVSFGPFNTERDVDTLIRALHRADRVLSASPPTPDAPQV
jgi:cysteine desulfurase family protein